jgi:lipopolysaccharide biosynthesis glycosyltransferase
MGEKDKYQEGIHLLYCGDSNIEKGLILSVLSVVRNVREPVYIRVFTMTLSTGQRYYAPVSEQCIAILDECVKWYHPASFVRRYDLSREFQRELPEANMKTRFTPYCMLRLFADWAEDIPDRILYLDNDVLCRKDFSEFYHQNLEGWEFAGVFDYYGSWLFRKHFLRRDYVNSGVLLLHMDMVRRTNLLEKCRVRCMTTKMFMPDQTALNREAKAKKIAKRKYNDQRYLHKDTVFQHFTTSFRLFPWLHKVTVKPWQTERMHRKLKLHEYDALLPEYHRILELMRHEKETREK